MADLRKRIQESENPLQELMSSIPGFEGYHDRQVRRQADHMLREHLVGLLDASRRQLDQVIERWSRAGKLDRLTDLDRVRSPLGRVRDTLRFAGSGYTGWFDAVKIKEAELDALYEYDLSLRAQIGEVGAAIQALDEADEGTLQERIGAALSAIEALQDAIAKREQVATRTIPE
jgi:predicted aminopeptidase